MAIISSNAVTIGRAALTAVRAQRLCDAAIVVAALSFEAIDADQSPLDARVHAARPLPGQTAVAARMRALLAGSDPRRHGPGLHDPLAFRCQPQVDGAAQDALAALHRVLAVELNAAAENPLVVAGPEPVALTTGNFHAVALALSLDGLRGALAQAASLVAARASALLDERFSGLRGWLAATRGASSGAMALEYTAHGGGGRGPHAGHAGRRAAHGRRRGDGVARLVRRAVGPPYGRRAGRLRRRARDRARARGARADGSRAVRRRAWGPGRSSSAWSPICPRDWATGR